MKTLGFFIIVVVAILIIGYVTNWFGFGNRVMVASTGTSSSRRKASGTTIIKSKPSDIAPNEQKILNRLYANSIDVNTANAQLKGIGSSIVVSRDVLDPKGNIVESISCSCGSNANCTCNEWHFLFFRHCRCKLDNPFNN